MDKATPVLFRSLLPITPAAQRRFADCCSRGAAGLIAEHARARLPFASVSAALGYALATAALICSPLPLQANPRSSHRYEH